MSCAEKCGKGRFSSCNPVNGTCECNACWMLDSKGYCANGNDAHNTAYTKIYVIYWYSICWHLLSNFKCIETAGENGYSCFLDYLMSPMKVVLMFS